MKHFAALLATTLCLAGCMQYTAVTDPIDTDDDDDTIDLPADPSTYAGTCAESQAGACFTVPLDPIAASYNYIADVQCVEDEDGVMLTAAQFYHLPDVSREQLTFRLAAAPLAGDHVEDLTLNWRIETASTDVEGGPDCYLDIAHGMPHLVATFQCLGIEMIGVCDCYDDRVDMIEGAIRCP